MAQTDDRKKSGKRLWIAAIGIGIAAVAALAVFKLAPIGRPGVIPHTEALKFIGQEKTVEGVVEYVWKTESIAILYFDYGGHESFVGVVKGSNFGSFPPGFETLYEGKKIRLKGKIETYKGFSEIHLKEASQIQIIGMADIDLLPDASNLIPFGDAAKFVDQTKTVEGVVQAVSQPDAQTTWLSFDPANPSDVKAVIYSNAFQNFPAGFETYKGKKIWVVGKIRKHKGQLEIPVFRPSRIRVVDER